MPHMQCRSFAFDVLQRPLRLDQARSRLQQSQAAGKWCRHIACRAAGTTSQTQVQQQADQQQQNGAQNGARLIQRVPADQYTEQAYLTARTRRIAQHFPDALGIDDFLNRLEIALFAYGFTGQNSIGGGGAAH